MHRKQLTVVLAVTVCLSLACNLLTNPTTLAPDSGQPPINVETSVAGTRAFEFAVQTAAAGQASGPTSEVPPGTSQPPGPAVEPASTVPLVSASMDTNCRTGPSTVYEVISYLLVGKSSEVVNKYQNGLWWVIKDPNNPTRHCWVWGTTTSVTGNWQQLQEATLPPTPTVQLVMTIAGSATPANFWGTCPVTITYTWNITSTLPVNMAYRVESSLSPFSAILSESFGPGTKTVNYSHSINADGNYWERFIIEGPLNQSKQIDVTVNCL
jgi:hypothetical protein